MWEFVTGSSTYEEVYNNRQETRLLSDQGIIERAKEVFEDVEFKDFMQEMGLVGIEMGERPPGR